MSGREREVLVRAFGNILFGCCAFIWRTRLSVSFLVYIRSFVVLALGFGASMPSWAHDASLTLVHLEPTRLELTFSLDKLSILQRSMAPQLDPVRFIIDYAEMSPASFEAELFKAEARLEKEIRIEGPGGEAFALGQWQWPPSAELQEQIRQLANMVLTGPTTSPLPRPLIVTVSARSKGPMTRVHLLVPDRLRPILLVRPEIEQFWIDDFVPDAYLDF